MSILVRGTIFGSWSTRPVAVGVLTACDDCKRGEATDGAREVAFVAVDEESVAGSKV